MRRFLMPTAALLALGCGATEPEAEEPTEVPISASDVTKVEPGKADTSAEAIILDFAFSGELRTGSSWSPEAQIEEQLLYTVGQLNGSKAVGRLDKIQLADVVSEAVEGGTRVTYKASLQVAWRKASNVPTTYTFELPRDVSYQGKQAFTDSYSHDCVDYGAHDVTPGSMWYYYRPARFGCEIDPADVVKAEATVTVSDVNTTGKYPEYDRVWSDGVFNVVAVFGKYEDGATTASDAGVAGYNRFNGTIRDLLEPHDLSVWPTDAPRTPGTDVTEIVYDATLDATHQVVVTTLLVDNVRTAGADFNQRYGELSKTADLIVYNGHAGLGANIRALARKGDWQAGQYVMVFMNGCDTYAYVDTALFDAHAAVNPDDAVGTRYADVITNALPSFFASMAGATMALVKGIIAYDQPLTYEQIFRGIDSSQIVLVSGEEDNEYVPGGGEAAADTSWEGVSLDGALAEGEESRFETPTLPAGTYTFSLTGTGDADLYVRMGLAPSLSEFDCRPYRAGSVETCQLELTAPTTIHGMVRGFAANSTFELVGLSE